MTLRTRKTLISVIYTNSMPCDDPEHPVHALGMKATIDKPQALRYECWADVCLASNYIFSMYYYCHEQMSCHCGSEHSLHLHKCFMWCFCSNYKPYLISLDLSMVNAPCSITIYSRCWEENRILTVGSNLCATNEDCMTLKLQLSSR